MSDQEQEGRVHSVFGDETLSPLKKYALLAVGSPGIGALLRYELIILFCSRTPGALGYWLRRKLYRFVLGSMGRNVTIGAHVAIRGGAKISVGNDVFIDDNCVLDARGESSMRLGDRVLVARNTIIRARDGTVDIDDGADIGCNCIIGTDSSVRVGKEVLVAGYAYLVAGGNHNIDDPEVPIIRQGVTSRGGIVIGDGAWLGARVTVLDGCEVGEGTVVGSHGLVTKSLPARVIAHGTPATVVRDR